MAAHLNFGIDRRTTKPFVDVGGTRYLFTTIKDAAMFAESRIANQLDAWQKMLASLEYDVRAIGAEQITLDEVPY
jgi:hypothetical protein